ncbi:hypothetical protein [Streptomyces sp. NPDC056628]|uniref:hypothetical protein n=1 Tax=Streptomyces sp. NPDC056628 TaxID=3345882 RepID=UPI00367F6217
MFGMLSVLAWLQRELIAANTMDGLAAARARGRVGGRRPGLTEDQAALAQQLYDARERQPQERPGAGQVPYRWGDPPSRSGGTPEQGVVVFKERHQRRPTGDRCGPAVAPHRLIGRGCPSPCGGSSACTCRT